ncbi:hypothetical protein L1987_88047 [Smallanthus sonchifolius]|nr:hypothetical protein L1987_88047 [Smallanthus sonchifolius]
MLRREEELQLQKLKKRKIKANPRLSFSEDVENGEEEDGEDKNTEPTYSFSEREADEQAERERLRKQWLREQEQIKNEALEITYSYWDGAGHRRVMQLFHFDVHEDVRTIADATIEKDESHAGKVVERHWYEKNKHIFPASRWEIYDPTKKWERYTIHGD